MELFMPSYHTCHSFKAGEEEEEELNNFLLSNKNDKYIYLYLYKNKYYPWWSYSIPGWKDGMDRMGRVNDNG